MNSSHHDHEYHALEIVDVIDETSDTRSFVLDIPAELTETFAYQAGQFCTFRATIDGHEVVRCYSMSSSPDAGEPFTTAVKRVPWGVTHGIGTTCSAIGSTNTANAGPNPGNSSRPSCSLGE